MEGTNELKVNLHQLLRAMIEKGASDLHIATGSPPLLRVDGSVVPLKLPPLGPVETRQLCYSVLTEEQRRQFESGRQPFGIDVLVDDILDTGRTMQRLMQEIRDRGATSVRCAVLLWKRSRTVVDLQPDYFGFEIPDEFVVGFGLDFNDDYRHLPYIGVLESD